MGQRCVCLLFMLLGTAAVFAQTKKPSASTQIGSGERDGSVVFQQQCARCHAAPEGFSPRIAGTIVRHMRVRAGISHEEEKALMRFFNP